MTEAMTKEGLYSAFVSKDTRFDGRFFVGISSTGIYCRPVCHARQPKEENCTFYETAGEAEAAGYRPCLLCRPELAPGRSITDARANLARRAARLLEEDCKSGQSLERLAARLGCTDRHLRRVFASEYKISPVRYLQTCRLLLAKNLLTETDLPVVDVAMAAGFGSLRRFNDLFKSRYSLSPTSLRKQSYGKAAKQKGITVQLGYRPPYRWEDMLDFFAKRAIPGVEAITGGTYCRAVRHAIPESGEVVGWIEVGHNASKNTLSVTASESLLPAMYQVLGRVRNLFDLYCEPNTIYDALSTMNDIRPGLCALGTRVAGCYDPFEMAVRAILGQEVTGDAASALVGRIARKLGRKVETAVDGVSYLCPTPCELLDAPLAEGLGALGVTSPCAATIEELAKALVAGAIVLDSSSDPEAEMKKLASLEGMGDRAAQYIAMRTLGWPDAFLETDTGIEDALASSSSEEAKALAEAWRPWRSYVTANLWNSLDACPGS